MSTYLEKQVGACGVAPQPGAQVHNEVSWVCCTTVWYTQTRLDSLLVNSLLSDSSAVLQATGRGLSWGLGGKDTRPP